MTEYVQTEQLEAYVPYELMENQYQPTEMTFIEYDGFTHYPKSKEPVSLLGQIILFTKGLFC